LHGDQVLLIGAAGLGKAYIGKKLIAYGVDEGITVSLENAGVAAREICRSPPEIPIPVTFYHTIADLRAGTFVPIHRALHLEQITGRDHLQLSIHFQVVTHRHGFSHQIKGSAADDQITG